MNYELWLKYIPNKKIIVLIEHSILFMRLLTGTNRVEIRHEVENNSENLNGTKAIDEDKNDKEEWNGSAEKSDDLSRVERRGDSRRVRNLFDRLQVKARLFRFAAAVLFVSEISAIRDGERCTRRLTNGRIDKGEDRVAWVSGRCMTSSRDEPFVDEVRRY